MRTTQRTNTTNLQSSEQDKSGKQPNKFILNNILFELLKAKEQLIPFLSDKLSNEDYQKTYNEAKLLANE